MSEKVISLWSKAKEDGWFKVHYRTHDERWTEVEGKRVISLRIYNQAGLCYTTTSAPFLEEFHKALREANEAGCADPMLAIGLKSCKGDSEHKYLACRCSKD